MAVTLINVFSVPVGKEDEFVTWWHDVKANITKRPGFMPYQIVGNHETTAKVHGEHKGVCFPGVG
jgi:antibiotic biosynthesis monooxygenase (ABM) superfamily enzyme